MAGYKDLAMGPHDEGAMKGPELLRAFERFVSAERELAEVLRGQLEEYAPLLEQARKG
jgi:hypothetical protein